MNLEVAVGANRFRNPLVLASGTFGYGLTFTDVVQSVGVIVTKGITVKPRKGNPVPRIWDSRETVVNSVGLENVGLERFKSQILPSIKVTTPVYVNLAGVTPDDFRELVLTLNDDQKVAGFELNLSCPNVKEGGTSLGQSPITVARVTELCRSLTKKTVWVKLTSNFCDVRETSLAAAGAGADAIVLVNTLNALVIDTTKRKPFLGAGSGGLSGPALKPHVLYIIREVSRRISIPIIGSGGAISGLDVIDFLLSGASMVQIGSANLVDPESALRILKEIQVYFEREGISSPSELIGRLEER